MFGAVQLYTFWPHVIMITAECHARACKPFMNIIAYNSPQKAGTLS
jgi:hypothetical protein